MYVYVWVNLNVHYFKVSCIEKVKAKVLIILTQLCTGFISLIEFSLNFSIILFCSMGNSLIKKLMDHSVPDV